MTITRAGALRSIFLSTATAALLLGLGGPANATESARDELAAITTESTETFASGFAVEFTYPDSNDEWVGSAGWADAGDGRGNTWIDSPGQHSWRVGPAYGGDADYLTWASSLLAGGHGDMLAQQRANRRGHQALRQAGISGDAYVRVTYEAALTWPRGSQVPSADYVEELVGDYLNPAASVAQALADENAQVTREGSDPGQGNYRVVTVASTLDVSTRAGVITGVTVSYPDSALDTLAIRVTASGSSVTAPEVPGEIVDSETLNRVLGPTLLIKFRIGMASDISYASRAAEYRAETTGKPLRVTHMVAELKENWPGTYRVQAAKAGACIELRTAYGTVTAMTRIAGQAIKTRFLPAGHRCLAS